MRRGRVERVRCGTAAPSRVATRSPALTRAPFADMRASRCVPAAEDGTSMVALSVSSVMSGVSSATVSPALHQHFDDLDVLEVAEIGNAHFERRRLRSAVRRTRLGGSPAARRRRRCALLRGCRRRRRTSTSAIAEPFDTRSPFLTATSARGRRRCDGTSIVALSVSSVISGVSSATVVAGLHQHFDDLDVVRSRRGRARRTVVLLGHARSADQRIGLGRIDAELLHRERDARAVDACRRRRAPCSAATTIQRRSTSKWSRSAARESLRP